MNAEAVPRTTGYVLSGAAVLAYFSRPWFCGYALSQFTYSDAVPYAHFDRHGLLVIFAWLSALIFAGPMLWLASRVFLNRVRFGVFGRGPDTKTTLLSVLVALALGAPTHAQLAYLIRLPISVAAPVLASSLVWLLIVEIGRTAAVNSDLLGQGVGRVAIAVALLVTAPKLVLIGLAAMNV